MVKALFFLLFCNVYGIHCMMHSDSEASAPALEKPAVHNAGRAPVVKKPPISDDALLFAGIAMAFGIGA